MKTEIGSIINYSLESIVNGEGCFDAFFVFRVNYIFTGSNISRCYINNISTIGNRILITSFIILFTLSLRIIEKSYERASINEVHS